MKNNLTLFVVVFYSLLASCQTNFDKQVWLENSDMTKSKNPRRYMVDDLKDNYLKIGMHKKDIIKLLGKPYSDTITSILPKGKQLPDSLKVDYDIKRSKEEERVHLAKCNKWYSDHHILVPLIDFPIGWSLMDPIFLEIRLNEDNKVVDFWVAQH